eukprot:14720696-Alexandrium_andersonii.AAC.1
MSEAQPPKRACTTEHSARHQARLHLAEDQLGAPVQHATKPRAPSWRQGIAMRRERPGEAEHLVAARARGCLLYTSPSPRD